MIDHLLWAVPELEAGCRQMQAWTGVEPMVGGRHPGVGTHNALLSLGTGTYLELIALDPSQDCCTGLGTLVQHLKSPALITWCAPTKDLDGLAASARAAGLNPTKPISMSRRRPDGVQLRWRNLTVDGHPFGPLIPFFIQWDTDHHPSQSTPKGCYLESLQIQHPEAKGLVGCLEVLGLEVEVVETPQPRLKASIRTPRGKMNLPPRGVGVD